MKYYRNLKDMHCAVFGLFSLVWLKGYVLTAREVSELYKDIYSKKTMETLEGVDTCTLVTNQQPSKWESIVFVYNNAGPLWKEKMMLYLHNETWWYNEYVDSYFIHWYILFVFLICLSTKYPDLKLYPFIPLILCLHLAFYIMMRLYWFFFCADIVFYLLEPREKFIVVMRVLWVIAVFYIIFF